MCQEATWRQSSNKMCVCVTIKRKVKRYLKGSSFTTKKEKKITGAEHTHLFHLNDNLHYDIWVISISSLCHYLPENTSQFI